MLFARMRSFGVLLLLGVLVGASFAQGGDLSANALRAGFAHPPESARPRCYWWWLNGNTTADTITRDLKEMKEKGFGGAILVDADGSGEQGNRAVPEGPVIGSPAWTALFVHALDVAQKLGLEISLNVTSRWNVGIIGDDRVTAEDAMKLLTWSRTTVEGNGQSTVRLAVPRTENHFYRPIAVLAYPLHHGAALPGELASNRNSMLDLEFKTASMETGFSMPAAEDVLRTAPSAAGEEDASIGEVVDLSEYAGDDGMLHWKIPQGQWEILQIGYTDTEKTLLDGKGDARGLPLDALSAEAFDHYWQRVVAPLLAASKPYIGTSLRYLVTDSWEAGGANWTKNFREEFRRRRGYDPVPYLPIVAGRILSSRAASEQFLFDLRRTVADLITENYYDRFAAHANDVGLGTHSESGGPHGAPIDALETFRRASFPQTEFWADSGWHRMEESERFFVKEASSAAHIYGKNLVAAEGPTSMNLAAWSEALASNVQPAIDHAFTEGLNRIFWHEFTSSPVQYGKPGQEYFAGTHLNPNVTWWTQAAPFLRSQARAQFLLQQGRPVSDLLYYYGEQVPGFVHPKSDDPAHLLPGYDYDVVNEDALLHRMRVHGAEIVTPEGISYRALALPASRELSSAALAWVERYVEQGGIVIGEAPHGALGIEKDETLSSYDRRVDALWKRCKTAPSQNENGIVTCENQARKIFAQLGVTPDFSFSLAADSTMADDGRAFDFVHRHTATSEIYFVRNARAVETKATLSFRVKDRAPELWSPDTGTITDAVLYRNTAAGRTEIPLTMPAYGSIFVIFEHVAGKHLVRLECDGKDVFPSVTQGENVFAAEDEMVAGAAGHYRATDAEGRAHDWFLPMRVDAMKESHWSLSFPDGWGAPTSIPVEQFGSWTESGDAGVRYFSGTATYRTTMHFSETQIASSEELWLDLGSVREIATVRVNGHEAGTQWRAPYAVRLDPHVHAGDNLVEIEVSNLWPNRLIGDLQPDAAKKYTRTNVQAYRADSPLLPSGILAPVVVHPMRILHWR